MFLIFTLANSAGKALANEICELRLTSPGLQNASLVCDPEPRKSITNTIGEIIFECLPGMSYSLILPDYSIINIDLPISLPDYVIYAELVAKKLTIQRQFAPDSLFTVVDNANYVELENIADVTFFDANNESLGTNLLAIKAFAIPEACRKFLAIGCNYANLFRILS